MISSRIEKDPWVIEIEKIRLAESLLRQLQIMRNTKPQIDLYNKLCVYLGEPEASRLQPLDTATSLALKRLAQLIVAGAMNGGSAIDEILESLACDLDNATLELLESEVQLLL